jgi:hypothetical protein
MDTFGLVPHSCQHCRKIEIDGTLRTGRFVEQSFRWTLRIVQRSAEECMLFRWSLQLQTRNVKTTDHLVLSISTNHEDLAYFEAEWREAHDKPVLGSDGEQSSLSIFFERSTFFCKRYAHTLS